MLTNPPEPSELERARRRHDDVVDRARQIHRRRLTTRAGVGLAVAALLVTIPIGLAHSAHPDKRVVTTAPTPTVCSVDCASSTTSGPVTTPTTAATPTTTAPLLERGKEAPRSAIPWSQVGPGWTLALWGVVPGGPSGELSGGGAPPPPEAQTLYLVNPVGGRYVEATFAAGVDVQLADWSATGRTALLAPGNRQAPVPLTTVDLVGGQTSTHTVSVDGSLDYNSLGLTRPNGRAMLVSYDHIAADNSNHFILERRGLDGALQLTYPGSFTHVGAYGGWSLPAPDGSQLIMGAATGVALVGNDGHVVRELPVPGATGCQPMRWWDTGTIVAQCDARLWLVPTSGAAPTPLTAAPTGTGRDQGDLNAWKVGATTYVQAAAGCGVVYLASLNHDGTTAPVDVPGVDNSDSVGVLGTAGNLVEVFATAGCGGGQSVMWFDPVTKATAVVLGPPLNGGGVTSALAYPDQ